MTDTRLLLTGDVIPEFFEVYNIHKNRPLVERMRSLGNLAHRSLGVVEAREDKNWELCLLGRVANPARNGCGSVSAAETGIAIGSWSYPDGQTMGTVLARLDHQKGNDESGNN